MADSSGDEQADRPGQTRDLGAGPRCPIALVLESAYALCLLDRLTGAIPLAAVIYSLRYLQHRAIGTLEVVLATCATVYVMRILRRTPVPLTNERTFLGVIPIITSTNLTMRVFLSSRLKSRIDK
jgi:hypothetical protein